MNYGTKVLIRGDCESYSVHEITDNFYIGKIVTIEISRFNGEHSFKPLEDKDGFVWCTDMIDKIIIDKE